MLGRLSRISSPILACAWYGLIYVLSSGPTGSRIGPISGSWMLNTGHSLLFGLLALWIVLGLPRAGGWPVVKPASVAFVLGLVLILGALDELHQGSVAGRSMSAADVLTDLTGATCVLWICAYSGSAAAGERGLRTRLGLAIAACFAAGAVATLSDNYLG
jgi:hypothetical protein